MPYKSESQKHLMQAAAHTPGGYGGVPQSVGEKFEEHKNDEMPIDPQAGPMGRAAGILFLTDEGEILLVRRGNGGDYPHMFSVPGGHLDYDETSTQAARREALEETGLDYDGPLELLHDDGQFATYIARNVKKFDVKVCDESTGYVWCKPEEAPMPLHPGLEVSLRIASAKTELDIAKLMSEGLMPSPQPYANMHLLAIRITGTGLAYRSSIGEHVWRDPSLYLNDEFLQRCNGLMVIMDHPDKSVLDSKEFKDRAIGSVMLSYIKGEDVWGIAKIYDDLAFKEISEGDVSTSPSVVFGTESGNITLKGENGDPLLIEGVPFLLDHIAIVTKDRGSRGVWDKDGPIEGVLLNNDKEVSNMSETTEPKADAAGDKLDAILSAVTTLSARVDSMEKNMPAPELLTAADKKKRKDDDMKKDDDDDCDDARKDDDEEEEEKSKKDDDMKMRKDKMRKDKMRKDAGVVEGPAGEIRPDDEEMMDDDAKKDDDDAKKDDDMAKDDDEMAARKDEEEAKFADCQAAADSVFSAFGKSATRPLKGESLLAYRTRLLRGLQAYSDAYKDVNLRSIKDAKLLNIAERQIFTDALAFAKSPLAYADGQLVEINERDNRTGRTITKFRGPVSAWLDEFKVPALRATQFHTNNNKR